MVVVSEFDPGGIHALTQVIELLRVPTPVRERHSLSGHFLILGFRGRAMRKSRRRADDVLKAERLSELDDVVEMWRQICIRIVGAHAMQPRLFHGLLHVARAAVKKSRSLNLTVTHRAQLMERSFIIAWQQIPHGVELQSEWQAQWIRHQPGCIATCGGESHRRRCSLQKISSGDSSHGHRPCSETTLISLIGQTALTRESSSRPHSTWQSFC